MLIKNINSSINHTEIQLRGRVHALKILSKRVFVILRQGLDTIQIVFEREHVERVKCLTLESIIKVTGKVIQVKEHVKNATCKCFEILGSDIEIVAVSQELMIPVDRKEYMPQVSLHQRLDNRVIDIRNERTMAIMRIKSIIMRSFREFMEKREFTEINTPKIVASKSEGGSEVFELSYFQTKAYLAQSPQLYKQMAIIGDMQRVYEIGPVFRAENSQTHRHLTEFTGLDIEMEINTTYEELMDLVENFIQHAVEFCSQHCRSELEILQKYGHSLPVINAVRLTHKRAVELLKSKGESIQYGDDLNSKQERILGEIVKSNYNSDMFIVDKFPLKVRAFYTMPYEDVELNDVQYGNCFDVFIRGQEICSGSQRIHTYNKLMEVLEHREISPESLKSYLDSFKYGAPPHGGFGIGLERLVQFLLGLPDVREVSMFARDPSRLVP